MIGLLFNRCPFSATWRMAARMRIWVPHRQRLGSMCSRICCSVGRTTCSTHDHAGDAVAALHSLLVDEGLLQCPGLFCRAKALNGAHFPCSHRRRGEKAREDGAPVNQHGTRAALSHSAAKLGSVELKVIPECVERGVSGVTPSCCAWPLTLRLIMDSPPKAQRHVCPAPAMAWIGVMSIANRRPNR